MNVVNTMRQIMSYRNLRNEALVLVGIAMILYLAVSSIAFGFRHPWATETERFLHTWDAICWRTISYKDMRPQERDDHDQR
jgi:hypothetical protein